MPRALVVSKNLIGDTLYITPVLRFFMSHNLGWEFDLLTNKDFIEILYQGMRIPWRKVFYSEAEVKADPLDGGVYDRVLVFRAGEAGELANNCKMHITEAYAEMNELEVDEEHIETAYGRMLAVKPYYYPEDTSHFKECPEHLRNAILFSPYSASCASQEKNPITKESLGKQPNKMLPWSVWKKILEYLSCFNAPIFMLGGKEHKLPTDLLRYASDSHLTGMRLDDLAMVMRSARLIVTVDNGMGHLAASQNCNHVVFYPACLGMHFIIPWGAPKTVPIQLDPARADVDRVMAMFKRVVRMLGV